MGRSGVRRALSVVAAVIVGTLVMTGCTPRYSQSPTQREAATAPTPYQPGGLPKLLGVGVVVNPFEYPHGYQEEKLGAASYKVIAEANVFTTGEQATNIMLMRAAELGQQNGFDKFRMSYISVGGICRDNTGFQRKVAAGLFQYGRGDGPVGADDRELTREAERANARRSIVPARLVNKEFKVADVIRDLESKVRNPVASDEERTATAKKFQTDCWGPS